MLRAYVTMQAGEEEYFPHLAYPEKCHPHYSGTLCGGKLQSSSCSPSATRKLIKFTNVISKVGFKQTCAYN